MLPRRGGSRPCQPREWSAAPRRAAPAAPRGSLAGTVVARGSIAARGVGDFLRSMFDFEAWAPKSARIWRLQQYDPPPAAREEREPGAPPSEAAALADRISQLRAGSPPGAAGGGPSSSSALLGEAASRSFSESDDDEISAALGSRISQLAVAAGGDAGGDDAAAAAAAAAPLTGPEIRSLLLTKYGKQYDLSFVKREVPGMKTFVSLNIMWLHAEQRSFKMSPSQYAEKLEGVAALCNALGQTDKVRAFLSAPAKSQNGLPRRPVVGTAITIRFDLPQPVIDEWFGSGYS
ncbi:hypothetical protein HT031_003349 [Scenedesmus sp. PABB004]|nr:hypothetical protein HT031_003349 [Scenedesmus sp. PABB004]